MTLARSETPTALSEIWTLVAHSIFHDDPLNAPLKKWVYEDWDVPEFVIYEGLSDLKINMKDSVFIFVKTSNASTARKYATTSTINSKKIWYLTNRERFENM